MPGEGEHVACQENTAYNDNIFKDSRVIEHTGGDGWT